MSGRKVVKPASGVTGVFRERLEKTAKGNEVAAAGSAVGKRERKKMASASVCGGGRLGND